jgi:hypothetical protein
MPPITYLRLRKSLSLILAFALWILLIPVAHSANLKRSPKKAAAKIETSGASKAEEVSPKSNRSDVKNSNKPSEAQIVGSYGHLPLTFEANEGQSDERVKFLSQGNGFSLFMTSRETVMVLNPDQRKDDQNQTSGKKHYSVGSSPSIIKTSFEGASPDVRVTGMEQLAKRTNYFIGNNPDKWRTDVLSYGRVKYEGLYPGIDAVYYGNEGQLEYDLIVAPGANPGDIKLNFEGARKIRIVDGDLVLKLKHGEIIQRKPIAYQNMAGTRRDVACDYRIIGRHQVALSLGKYDANQPLVIDPVFIYSTYLGGSAAETGRGIAVDGSGNAYVIGWTTSTNFPTASPFQAALNGAGPDIFISKMNASGTGLVYSTYLGGSGDDYGIGIALDSSGNVYLTGYTNSTNFPTSNPFQSTCNNCSSSSYDAFVTKLNPTGSALVYSTYLGGSGNDQGWGVAVDSLGAPYLTGNTNSTDFPTALPFQPNNSGGDEAFVTKFDPTGTTLVYSTYLGGSAIDDGRAIAVDTSGSAYVTGYAFSTNFPTVNAFQPNKAGSNDAFITKFTADGSALIYSTYLGGVNDDQGWGIAVDSSNNAFVTGRTKSTNFPSVNAVQPSLHLHHSAGGDFAEYDAFVTKINDSGTALIYSTFLGGDDKDYGYGIAVDSSGNAYVVGHSQSFDFPVVNPVQTPANDTNAFIAKLAPAGNSLIYSSCVGGDYESMVDETAYGVAADSSGNAYVTGETSSATFPTANPFHSSLQGANDAFVFKISDIAGYTVSGRVADSSGVGLSGVTMTLTGSRSRTTQSDANGNYSFTHFAPGSNATITPSKVSYTFSPTSQTFNNLSADQTANFTGIPPPANISGRVTDFTGTGVSSVTMTLSGSRSATTTTNSTGNYSFSNLPGGGTYTVTPSRSTDTFNPTNQTFTSAVGNYTVNFTLVYRISGRVTDSLGAAIANATMTLSGSQSGTTSTDASGNYAFANLPAKGNYTVTPFKDDPLLTYTFAPVSQSYTALAANQTANFTGTTSNTSTLYPIADAYVQDGTTANTNFGTANPLLLQTNSKAGIGLNRDVYFTFDLSGVSRSISSVKLSVYAAVSAAGSVATAAYSVANTAWIENGTGSITWNNKPARSATALTGATATVTTTAFTKYDIDVTNYVKSEKAAGRNVVSLALHNGSSTTLYISVNSRESATNKPQLFITLGNSDNSPPTVNLTAPANGASYTAPANVTLTATASDTDGSISKVDFYSGTALIGTSTASPYTFNWTNVDAGNYSLIAVATDNSGASTASTAANIVVNVPNSLPTVSLIAPLNGTTYSAGSNLNLSANASDTDGTISKVEFFAGATLIGTATTPSSDGSYNISWNNIPSGAYALTAKATDNAGGATTSSAMNIDVVSQTGLLPTADAYVRDGTFAGTNFGLATELQVQTSATAGSNRESYLKFDTTSVTGVTKAKIRLYGKLSDTSDSNVPIAIYSVASTSWSETTVKWSAKLVSGTTPLDTVNVTDNNPHWYEWDVTSYVQSEKAAGRPVVSFALKATRQSTAYATFNSREATSDQSQMVLQNTAARTALFVAASTTLNTSETALKTRLTNLGFTVTVIVGKNATTTSSNGKALVVISSTVLPTDVNTKFKNSPVPVVDWESDIFDDLGMTGSISGTDFGTATTQTQLSIINASHPLAAGLSGTQTVVTTASSFTWGKPNANAIKIATLTSDATKIVIFGYEKDATMPGLDAPARRVGFFVSDTTGVNLNSGGNSLFDAAIKWATEIITGPNISSLSPPSGPIGTTVTIRGINFGAIQDGSIISFNGVNAFPTSWSNNTIVAPVPPYATTGPVVVTVNGVISNALTFTIADVDSDGDGLPDWWEMLYFGNLNQGTNDDPDGDGITNLQEYLEGRNPTKSALSDDGDFVNLKVHTPLRP